ncbi:hypothetical protein ACFQ2M_34930 [Kitasatospora saccharophila]|uniref:hypothetical protein n=1 Tax=Kitasatospora saccharophila TaxID=407973 RepID=UPI003634BD60
MGSGCPSGGAAAAWSAYRSRKASSIEPSVSKPTSPSSGSGLIPQTAPPTSGWVSCHGYQK